jgi:ornithine cyclodeaminase
VELDITQSATRVFSTDEVRQVCALDDELVRVVERGFRELGHDRVSMPPIFQLLVGDHGGQTCVKGGWVIGDSHFAIKLASLFPSPTDLTSTVSHGMYVIMDAATGQIRACVFDGGHLTQARTAAAGAVAAKYLAPHSVSAVAIIGSGRQALLQLRALRLARHFDRVLIWSRVSERAARLASSLRDELPDVDAVCVPSPAAAVAEAQVAITCTPARHPLLSEVDLHPGLHITAVGADAPGKKELSTDLIERADLVVPDDLAQSRTHGELQSVANAPRELTALGDVVAGKHAGRSDEHQVTVADLTGLGVQDTVAAGLALRRLLDSEGSGVQ